jgi:hypothetical protein
MRRKNFCRGSGTIGGSAGRLARESFLYDQNCGSEKRALRRVGLQRRDKRSRRVDARADIRIDANVVDVPIQRARARGCSTSREESKTDTTYNGDIAAHQTPGPSSVIITHASTRP